MAQRLAPRFSLGARIFLLLAGLLVLSLGAATAVTLLLGGRIAEQAAEEAISKSHSVQSAFQAQRFRQLGLMARVFADDPFINAYLAEAAEEIDGASILDQLYQRQEDLGFDFAIVLDADGLVLAHTDQPEVAGQDFSDRPLIEQALEENQGFGVWRDGDRLFSAVVVPLVRDFDLFGYLVTGYAIDDAFSREVRNLSSTEIAFFTLGPTGGLVSTTLDAGAGELPLRLRALGGWTEVLTSPTRRVLELDGEDWIAVSTPLRDALGEPVGAAMALASLDRQLASYRRIQLVLVGVGLATLLLGLLASLAMSRITMRPISDLLEAVEAAREGDYRHGVGLERSDEVGRLAQAFDGLLAELRDRQEMQSFLTDLSRHLPDPGTARALAEPATESVVLVAVENRSLAHGRATKDPGATMTRLNRDLRSIAAAASARMGRVESVQGHRALLSFEGADGVLRALQAAAQIAEELTRQESAFDEIEAPVLAIVEGEVVTGSVVFGDQPERAVAGATVRRVDSLLREGQPGEILLGREVRDRLTPAFEEAGQEIREQRGILSPRPLYVVEPNVAELVTAGPLPTMPLTDAMTAAGRPSPVAELGPGSVLGDRYDIVAVLGSGGMGVVYKAHDRELDDFVALKMLRQQLWASPSDLDRLKNEIRLARRITHENVLRTFDFGEHGGVPFISMEYVRGLTLRYLLQRSGRLPTAAGFRLARQLCAGLDAAHREGVLHRDIKPENLILQPTGNAKLMDFGIAQPMQRPDGSGEGPLGAEPEVGHIVGTPWYMSPEQVRGDTLDERSDLYSCGVLLYEVFTGRPPFSGTPSEVVQHHLRAEPDPPSERWRDCPPELERLLLRLLEKEATLRPRSAIELLRELEALVSIH